ncbi:hypothetical protein [Paenibacillus sp. IHBB 10380]|uniref:hypothetical protein n=1 Tax=Paenibacillus sp. IHBB 10380 TaxID=1566358 RepID=UPI0005CFD616|nr:hypothetical protein [Paenibacillus sp. IHBB 10380]AJS57371.1 hypothetical protein UB51_01410 [Paenibacillus sp. IHBB 10380]
MLLIIILIGIFWYEWRWRKSKQKREVMVLWSIMILLSVWNMMAYFKEEWPSPITIIMFLFGWVNNVLK